MDDVMVRSKYPRHSIPAKRRSRYGREKSKLPALVFKQTVACIILLLVIILVKNVNSAFTNFISGKVRYVLEQNIELDNVFKSVDNALGKLRDNRLIEDGNEEKDKSTDDLKTTGTQAGESKAKIPESSVLSATTETGNDLTVGMAVPVKGILSSSFGERKDPVTGIVKQHEGIDIDAADGEDIVAALDGSVVDTGNSKSYGKYIKIRHDDRFDTVYAHCSVVSVVEGQKAMQGDVIGKVGNTGASVGSHLHFEVWKDSKPVNPLEYINVLLP